MAHEYPDHHIFTPADLAFAATERDMAVLMTEKDAVKCETLVTSGKAAGQFWVVPLRVVLEPGLLTAVFDRITIK